jgi:hypothetical protein
MELNLSELTLTSFSSIRLNLTEFTVLNNLVVMVTIEHKQSKPRVQQVSPNKSELKMIEAMGLHIIALRYP